MSCVRMAMKGWRNSFSHSNMHSQNTHCIAAMYAIVCTVLPRPCERCTHADSHQACSGAASHSFQVHALAAMAYLAPAAMSVFLVISSCQLMTARRLTISSARMTLRRLRHALTSLQTRRPRRHAVRLHLQLSSCALRLANWPPRLAKNAQYRGSMATPSTEHQDKFISSVTISCSRTA